MTAIAPSVPTASGEDEIRAEILIMIAEKTGYPQDMLDLDLDMEADLGIDTVKQAELFAAIRELYSIPRRDNVALKDYPTIRHCVKFVMEEKGNKSQVTEQQSQVIEQQSQVTGH
ncbi:MAG TPA: hypothetical protein DCL44_07685, partial [Elusimicrobia bacterium]|nr:hypothetical protein [Elusimicrobiota bacterium]